MRLVISGSRAFPDMDAVLRYVSELPADTVVITGGARGVDAWAHRAAMSAGLDTEVYPANWVGHGRSAGPRRNERMAAVCDAVTLFWDGRSTGTKDMLQRAKRHGRLIRMYLADEGTV